jgi:hypothetical protein
LLRARLAMMKLMHRSVHLRAAESFGHGLTQSSRYPWI